MKIALLGYGKMGKAIERLARARGHEVVLIVDQLKQADVAIEFTTPVVAVDNYNWCFRNHVPVVSGTTGWLERWDEVMMSREQLGGGFFYASNYSIGVNIFFHLNRWLARTMARFADYKVSVEETHHIHKLDAPSGTALTLAKDILKEHPEYTSWVLDEGKVEAGELPVKAKREGEVPGIHSVTYKSGVDEIQIYHSAYSRDGFAQGAVMAAEFLMGKKGMFGMEDLIKIKDEN